MANEVMSTLFGVTPEALMAQREQQLQQRALQFAQLDPMQAAQAGFYTAGSRLGGAVGGLLGAEDPELMRIRQRQSLLQGVDPNDPKSLREAALTARQQGDSAAALQLAQKAMEVEAKQASIVKDLAAASRERQQAVPADIQKAQRIAALKTAIPAYEEAGDTTTANQLKAELGVLSAVPKTAQSELGKLIAERDALGPNADPAVVKAYNDKIKKLTTGGGIGSEIAAGLGPVMGALVQGQLKAASTEIGKDVGKNIASIDGKYEANYAVTDALDLLGKGIYAGGYAPLEETVAKYGMGVLGDKKRLANTQAFKAYLAEVVIPRLKDFGGSDTVEELKYLQSASGANTDIEPKALEQILQRAQKKINRGIERLQRQNIELQSGKPISIGPTGGKQQRTTKSGITYSVEE